MRRLIALFTVIALFAVTPLDAATAKKRRRVTRRKGRAVAAAPSIAGPFFDLLAELHEG